MEQKSVSVAAALFFRNRWLMLGGKVTNMVLLPQELEFAASFQEVVEFKPAPKALIVGAQLSAGPVEPGYRVADREMINFIGWPAASLVLPALRREETRGSLAGHQELRAAARQSGSVAVAAPYHQRYMFSGHPELSFRLMKGSQLTTHPRSPQGRQERASLLEDHFSEANMFLETPQYEVPLYYIQALLALLWSAKRASVRTIKQFPAEPTWDIDGRREQIVG